MRRTIRDQDLDITQRTIPSLVSLALNEEQALLVADLVTAFVVPNSLLSEQLTEETKQAAREAVEPVTQEYKAGEIIVLRGQIIRPQDHPSKPRTALTSHCEGSFKRKCPRL